MHLKLAWMNLWRKPGRAWILIVCTALMSGAVFVSYYFITSLNRSLAAASDRLGADVMVVPKGSAGPAERLLLSSVITDSYLPASVLESVRSIPGVMAATPQLYASTFTGTCCHTEGNYPVIGFDPSTDFTLKPWMSSSRPFQDHSLLIGSEAGGKNAIYHMDYGSFQEHLQLYHQTFYVQNILYPTGTEADKTIYMDLNTLYRLKKSGRTPLSFPENSLSIVLVKTAKGQANLVKSRIEQQIPGVSAIAGTGASEVLHQQLQPLQYLSYSVIFVAIGMGVMQAVALFSALVSERMREIGVFRAIGATTQDVLRLMLGEAFWAGLIGGFAGSLTAATLLYDNRVLFRKLFRLPLLFPNVTNTAWLAVGTAVFAALLAVAAAALPIWGLIRKEPYQAIREGGN